MSSQPRLILGTAAFGTQVNESQSHEILERWPELGFTEADTALLYGNGLAEKVIGTMNICQKNDKIRIATKANSFKGFNSEDIVNQLNTSLTSLNLDCVNIFYLHWPDHSVPIEETLKGVDRLHKEGKFEEFGLSNFTAWEVVEVYYICKTHGYILPTVYQGMYNALTRDLENELLVVLNKFGMRLHAYNPLAGGMLSGRYSFADSDDQQPKGRFFAEGDQTNDFIRTQYRARYWKDNYKIGVDEIQRILNTTYEGQVPLYEAAYRWLVHHSKLTKKDAIITGFSKPEHLETNVNSYNGGPLHDDVVKVIDVAWNRIKSDCPTYYR